MRFNLFFIAFTFLFINTGIAQETSIHKRQQKHVNKFMDAVKDNSEKKIYRLLDKNYRKEQLDFLEGRKSQLVNELFGGGDQFTQEYININLTDISRIEIAEVIKNKDGTYKYIFRIRNEKNDILKSLILLKKGRKYGFVGSVG